MSTSGREESREVAEARRAVEGDWWTVPLTGGAVHERKLRLDALVTAVRKDERERASEDLNATIHDILNQFTSFSREDAPTAYERDRSMYSFPIKRRDYLLGWEGAVYREHIREKLATPAEGGTE